ncbi:MAG: hypothetical protein ACRC62_14610 [Microcoleus sp.]
MLNGNEVISGLALAVAGFAYALFCFVLLPFRQYDFAAPPQAIAIAIAFTAAVNWLLSSSLLAGWPWVMALFSFQIAIILFCGEFVGGGLILSSLLFFGTAIVGITSIYTNFSQQKTLLIVGLATVFFLVSIYLFLIGGYLLKGKNPLQGSSKQMQPLLNERVEIITEDPQQLQLKGKTGKLTEINRYEVTVKLDDETLMWPYVDVWWQDIKAVDN